MEVIKSRFVSPVTYIHCKRCYHPLASLCYNKQDNTLKNFWLL